MLDAALIGADVATVPATTLLQLFKHPLTDQGIATFIEDAKAWHKG
jgi:transaldolase